MQRSALCRSRRELSNEYLLAKIGVDTAANEPSKVSSLIPIQAIQFHIAIPPDSVCEDSEPFQDPLARSYPYQGLAAHAGYANYMAASATQLLLFKITAVFWVRSVRKVK